MLLPYKTDAPLYHAPLATVGLIFANIAAFAWAYYVHTQTADFRLVSSLMLQLGSGLHPLQWLTANFIHLDIFHLLGNMLGLWVFGLIVEGKIGWRRFLSTYLLLGIGTMLVTQVLAQWMPWGHCCGASAAVYGLMGIAMIWAPRNEIEWFVFVPFQTATFEITVWLMAIIYLAIQLTIAALSTHLVTSELVHLIGAGFGIAIGIVMLHEGWVDCENWDLFSVWAGRNTMSREELARDMEFAAAWAPEELAQERELSVEKIRRVLTRDRAELALAEHRRMSNLSADWRLPEDILRQLAAACVKQQMFDDATLLMRDYLRQYIEYATPIRLKLAEVLIRRQQRPLQASRVLAKIPKDSLTPERSRYLRQLDQFARDMIEQGTLEPEPEDW